MKSMDLGELGCIQPCGVDTVSRNHTTIRKVLNFWRRRQKTTQTFTLRHADTITSSHKLRWFATMCARSDRVALCSFSGLVGIEPVCARKVSVQLRVEQYQRGHHGVQGKVSSSVSTLPNTWHHRKQQGRRRKVDKVQSFWRDSEHS